MCMVTTGRNNKSANMAPVKDIYRLMRMSSISYMGNNWYNDKYDSEIFSTVAYNNRVHQLHMSIKS